MIEYLASRILRGLAIALVFAASACSSGPTTLDFAEREGLMRAIGKMRSDIAPTDVPFDNRTLAENFRRIAFFESPDDIEVQEKSLTRWQGSIDYAVVGGTVTPQDRAKIAHLMERAERLSGLPVHPSEGNPNFLIFILTAAEQKVVASQIQARLGRKQRKMFDQVADFAWDCSVHAYLDEAGRGEIAGAIVYIRAEITGFYRDACLHEEIYQGLGLFNDDEAVRPSIFNDDQEFALLTKHDEYLLRILYDPRLSTGMQAAQAMPIVEQIVEEIRPDGV